jgi:hypothetical protein
MEGQYCHYISTCVSLYVLGYICKTWNSIVEIHMYLFLKYSSNLKDPWSRS